MSVLLSPGMAGSPYCSPYSLKFKKVNLSTFFAGNAFFPSSHLARDAVRGVSVALAPPSDGEVGDGVVVRAEHLWVTKDLKKGKKKFQHRIMHHYRRHRWLQQRKLLQLWQQRRQQQQQQQRRRQQQEEEQQQQQQLPINFCCVLNICEASKIIQSLTSSPNVFSLCSDILMSVADTHACSSGECSKL